VGRRGSSGADADYSESNEGAVTCTTMTPQDIRLPPVRGGVGSSESASPFFVAGQTYSGFSGPWRFPSVMAVFRGVGSVIGAFSVGSGRGLGG